MLQILGKARGRGFSSQDVHFGEEIAAEDLQPQLVDPARLSPGECRIIWGNYCLFFLMIIESVT